MIIRVIILILLSLQGKEKICRNMHPIAAWHPFRRDAAAGSGSWRHRLMVLMLCRGLWMSRMWWNTADPSEALGIPCSSIGNPRFSGTAGIAVGGLSPCWVPHPCRMGVFTPKHSKVDEIPRILG